MAVSDSCFSLDSCRPFRGRRRRDKGRSIQRDGRYPGGRKGKRREKKRKKSRPKEEASPIYKCFSTMCRHEGRASGASYGVGTGRPKRGSFPFLFPFSFLQLLFVRFVLHVKETTSLQTWVFHQRTLQGGPLSKGSTIAGSFFSHPLDQWCCCVRDVGEVDITKRKSYGNSDMAQATSDMAQATSDMAQATSDMAKTTTRTRTKTTTPNAEVKRASW